MGKTISTFLYCFLISFITSFSPEAFYASVKKFHFCMGARDQRATTELCTNFLTRK